MNPLSRLWWTAKAVGWDNVPRRALQAWRVKSGWLRRRTDPAQVTEEAFRRACVCDVRDQPALWQDRAGRFFTMPSAEQLRAMAEDSRWRDGVLRICQQALAGDYPFFSRWAGRLGWPPDFNRDPAHGITWPVGEHWTRTACSGAPRHDIKFVWEPNRFTLAYYLTRAFLRDGDQRWAEAFWTMFDAWVDQNPVQMSVAWGCGQEIAFRLMAMLTAAVATLSSDHATPSRLYALARLAWQSARRIDANINYAIAQENNHALSEALGLWTVGLLFPEFSQARRWQRRGRRILATECQRQIYSDGSFVQHSLSYHRVMLDDLMWCLRLAQINGQPLPNVVHDRFQRATDWLAQMVDPVSGRVPNYGANDGANVLPLACGDYLDYRPTLQAASWISRQQRCLDAGAWDEKLLWLCGSQALSSPVQPVARAARWSAPIGGYHILRGPASWLMTRCGTYRDRPHQADMLHVDLWYRGLNVLRDAGSFMYYHEDNRWQHYFHSTAAHNTVEIDGVDQMIKGPRFLWFRWPAAHVISSTGGDDDESVLDMQSDSYAWLPQPVTHRRWITRNGDTYTICDSLTSSGRHTARVRWRLIDAPWCRHTRDARTWVTTVDGASMSVCLESPAELDVQLIRGETSPPAGWESLYYGEKSPSPALIATIEFDQHVHVTTTIRLGRS